MIYCHSRDPTLLSVFLCYNNPCLSFPLDLVLHHDNQRLVVQFCNSIISTEVYCQRKYRTLISCWTWNRAEINKLRQICNLQTQRLLVYLGLKWWISFVVVFPTISDFLLLLVVLHGLYTTQHKRNANYKKGRALHKIAIICEGRSTFQT